MHRKHWAEVLMGFVLGCIRPIHAVVLLCLIDPTSFSYQSGGPLVAHPSSRFQYAPSSIMGPSRDIISPPVAQRKKDPHATGK
ncbi:hypothetical protein JB92DRAFT_2913314 [Gautieria morchelliformis]|nr:hypothetical protein JB92DRAFT_3065559 [Gautieria morchelliformis]KAF8515737.1 hypothetical protein JB92DRAFT_2913314 [Gautieria morchelliformis]